MAPQLGKSFSWRYSVTHLIWPALISNILLLSFSCDANEWTGPAFLKESDYSVVWQDEFNGQKLDSSKWQHRALGVRHNAVNVESQSFLDGDGHLVIETKRERGRVLTGMVSTQGLLEARFGYFEARVLLPEAVGLRSAFWLQSPKIGRLIGNPEQSGVEIDIFEYSRKPHEYVQHAIHWDGYRKDHKSVKEPITLKNSAIWTTYGLLWDCKGYSFFVNGAMTGSIMGPVSMVPEFMILSTEVPEGVAPEDSQLPAQFKIDYVRVFQRPPSAASESCR